MAHESAPLVIDALLYAGVWEHGEYIFASGKHANNKFQMDRVFNDRTATRMLFAALGEHVLRHNPDALWGVPTGGQEYAEELGSELGLEVIRLKRVSGGSRTDFCYATPDDEALATYFERMVGIEDITTELTSVNGLLSVGDLGERTVAIEAGWRRGTAAVEKDVGRPVDWVVEAPTPNIITPEHPFFQRFGHLAVHQAS